MSEITIRAIENNKKEIKKFVKFAWTIYKGNKYWVPPIIKDLVKFITAGPYLEIGVLQPFMAYRDGKPVGRIIAHVDKLHNEYFNEKRGSIGFFDCINDKAVSRALFNVSEKWLKEQGMETMEGPSSFNIYDSLGILMDDYKAIPPLECGYNHPYYADLFLDYGLEKSVDWYAFILKTKQNIPGLFYKMRDKVKAKENIRFYHPDLKKNFHSEFNKVKSIFSKAWEGNWGHYPLTEKQYDHFAEQLLPIVKEELITFVDYDGEMVGFILSIPDANPALQKANGRLFPFGLIKILLGLRKLTRIKTFMMGVLPEYRLKGLDVVMYLDTYEKVKELGLEGADMSLIVETNINMINALKHLGGKIYKTYRIFAKKI